MTDHKFIIRSLDSGDITAALGLSSCEGWNQTRYDWKMLIENPANKCIGATLEGHLIGTATALVHSEDLAWIGMVIVDKRFRGEGAGTLLLENILGLLQGISSIKLDATPAGEPIYHKLGFKGEFNILRMTIPAIDTESLPASSGGPVHIQPEDLSDVVRLDAALFGTGRNYLLTRLFKKYPEKAFIIRKDGELKGYIFGREGLRYNYIGPLFAYSDELAIELVSRSLESLKSQPAAIDVPADKTGFREWLELNGFREQRQFLRMFLKSNSSAGRPESQYLISGPEFG